MIFMEVKKIGLVLGVKPLSDNIDLEDDLRGRVDIAIKMLNDKVVSQLIFSGGITNSGINKSEADMMYDYAVSKGVDKSLLIKEDKALDTVGNAYFTRLILDKMNDSIHLYAITSCPHVKRSKYIFDMVMGSKYKVNFDQCLDFNNEANSPEHEKKSLAMAEKFFEGVMPGDMDEISYRLFTFHKYYKKH